MGQGSGRHKLMYRTFYPSSHSFLGVIPLLSTNDIERPNARSLAIRRLYQASKPELSNFGFQIVRP
jgi:hypothetical protein